MTFLQIFKRKGVNFQIGFVTLNLIEPPQQMITQPARHTLGPIPEKRLVMTILTPKMHVYNPPVVRITKILPHTALSRFL